MKVQHGSARVLYLSMYTQKGKQIKMIQFRSETIHRSGLSDGSGQAFAISHRSGQERLSVAFIPCCGVLEGNGG